MVFTRIPADEALKTSAANRSAKWPARSENGRLGPIAKPEPRPSFKLSPGESIFTIGSCFARHIELALRNQGFKVPALDFLAPKDELWAGTQMQSGILNKYTPMSMLNEIEFAYSEDDGRKYLIEIEDGQYLDAQLHTNITVSLERGLERRQQLRTLYQNAIAHSRVIIITLGLVEAWWDNQERLYLNDTVNTRAIKRFPGRFFFEVLSPETAISGVQKIVETLSRHGRDDQRIVMTVSPVPIARTFGSDDILVSNSYSKSALRVAAEVAQRANGMVDYFPSYESVMFSERNQTWEDDQVHVRLNIVNVNVEQMLRFYQPDGQFD